MALGGLVLPLSTDGEFYLHNKYDTQTKNNIVEELR